MRGMNTIIFKKLKKKRSNASVYLKLCRTYKIQFFTPS